MTSVAIDSEDSFDDDSFDENALVETLDHPSVAKVTPKHATVVYEEMERSELNPDASDSKIQKCINFDNIDSIIYPTNLETRDYQLDIVQKSLFENLLCAIPTGLGKTFIASTVMLNYFKWVKEMKIIFMAPTKPLVAQQIKAFVQLSGISMAYTDIMLDRVKRNRKAIWDSKRILFTTPQVVENDLKSGILDPNMVALLIIDEAHRARGNYAYTNVVKFLNRFNPSFRVLALTATPGLDIESIQSVVENLNISRIEIRTERDPDISKYIKAKIIDKLDCEPTNEISQIIEYICEAIRPVLEKANESGIYDITDPSKINHFVAMEKSQKVIKNPTIPEGLKWSYYFILQLLGTVGQFFRRLNIYGVKTFYSYFLEKYTEFTTKYGSKKSTNKLAAQFYYDENIIKLKKYVENLIESDKHKALIDKTHIEGIFSHMKFRYLVNELISFFSSERNNSSLSSSSCIIFTEFRESALEIVRVLGNANKTLDRDRIRPHIFIGQSKEKDKFDQQTYLDKIKPKRKKKGSPEIEEKKSTGIKGKKSDLSGRPADRIGSSENAQLKGMNQKVQKELIENFKSGEYNVLVATSIGEEGLDIGEVDLIICFDSTQSPIKNIQRMGRTGRKRDGKVLLLFSSNERQKFESSMGKYEWIQSQIKDDSNSLTYYDGSHNRIVPQDVVPILERRFVEIPKENEDLLKDSDVVDTDEFLRLATQTIQRKKPTSTKGKIKTKSKRNTKGTGTDHEDNTKFEKRFYMPANAETGFRPVARMVVRKVVDEDGNEISQSDTARSKSSNPLILDSDDDYNKELFGNFVTSSNGSSKGTAKASASDLFMSIIDLPTGEASIDLTRDEEGVDDEREKTGNKSNEERYDQSDIKIDYSMLNNISAVDDTVSRIEHSSNSGDNFSDVSFSELEKNAVKDSQIQSATDLDEDSIRQRDQYNKRKLYDLSSDVFSDDIDDSELISQLTKINDQPGPRPAKRTRQ